MAVSAGDDGAGDDADDADDEDDDGDDDDDKSTKVWRSMMPNIGNDRLWKYTRDKGEHDK